MSPGNHVSADDVAQFMRDYALHFAGRSGGVDQPAVDVNDLPARDEGVDRWIVDQNDVDILRVQPGGLDQWPGHIAQQCLGFGIAQDGLGGGGLNRHDQGRE